MDTNIEINGDEKLPKKNKFESLDDKRAFYAFSTAWMNLKHATGQGEVTVKMFNKKATKVHTHSEKPVL